MNWDSFKNKLNKEANQQKYGVDIDALWNAIEPDIDALNAKRDKKKRLFFWFFFSGILAITTAWLITSNYNKIDQDFTELSSIEQKDEFPKELYKDEYSSNKEYANNEIKENKLETVSSFNIEKQNNNSSIAELINSNEKSSITNVDEYNDSVKKSNTTISLLAFDVKKVSKESSIKKSTNRKIDYENITNEIPIKNKNVFTEIQDQGKNIIETDKVVSEKTTHEKPVSNQQMDGINNSIPLLIQDKGLVATDSTLNSATIQEEEISKVNLEIEADRMINDNPMNSSSSQQEPLFIWSMKAIAGLSYVNKTLEQKIGVDSELLMKRNTYESSLEASHYGFSVNVQHTSKFGLSIGLEQTNIAERYTKNDTETEVEMVDGVWVSRVNFVGDTINVTGDILQTTKTSFNKNIYNNYSLLDIPITITYKSPYKKWNLGVEAGVLANVTMKTKGIIPDEQFVDQDIKRNQASFFKSNVGISYQFGANIGRSFGKKMEWFIAPRVKVYPSDFTVTSYELSQKYLLIGGTVGFVYRIK